MLKADFFIVALIGLGISFSYQFSPFQYLIFAAILIQVVSVLELLSLFLMRGFLKVR